jgi:integrase
MTARGSDLGPLFVRLDREAVTPDRLTRESVRKPVAALARRAGVSGSVRPHGLRHIAVTEVLDRNGGDIRAAQDFARHSDPKTTMRYDRNRRDLAG